MYILKNAWINIERHLGRNILIGLIVLIIVSSSAVALSINSSANKLINSYKSKNELEVTFKLDMSKLRDKDTTYTKLTVDDIKKYADSDYVSSYYYTLSSSLSSDGIEAIDISEKFEKKDDQTNEDKQMPDMKNNDLGSNGDFKITAYSNISYATDFINGTSKIKDGQMISDDEDTIIISEELAEENNLKVDDTVTFYLPSDSSKTYTFKIVGIFETESDTNEDFMNMNALNSQNQIYTNETTINEILENDDTNSLNATIYLKNQNDLSKYTKEVKKKGLSEYYTVSDNSSEVTSALTPIKNISSFSVTFLIIILIVGALILSIINILNIRDRKYEIGVLRAIGMSKFKLILSLLTELFIVTVIAFIMGITIGKLVAQPVTNKMLESEISSSNNEEKTREENFGGKGFERPNDKNYIKNLDITLDSLTIVELFGFSILLVLISGSASAIFITKYNPNHILRNQN